MAVIVVLASYSDVFVQVLVNVVLVFSDINDIIFCIYKNQISLA